MYGSRTLSLKKKPVIVLDKRFKSLFSMESGNQGYCEIDAVVIGDKLLCDDEGNEKYVKILEVQRAEPIYEKPIRS